MGVTVRVSHSALTEGRGSLLSRYLHINGTMRAWIILLFFLTVSSRTRHSPGNPASQSQEANLGHKIKFVTPFPNKREIMGSIPVGTEQKKVKRRRRAKVPTKK